VIWVPAFAGMTVFSVVVKVNTGSMQAERYELSCAELS
jgi:hypothetical protein